MIRVLIADDELYFRNYMLTAVDWHSLGFQVCSLAQNGEEVLSELSKNTINIVFLDINMPHINGLILAEKNQERISPYYDCIYNRIFRFLIYQKGNTAPG